MGRPRAPSAPPARPIARRDARARTAGIIGATIQRETQGVKLLRSFAAGVIDREKSDAAP